MRADERGASAGGAGRWAMAAAPPSTAGAVAALGALLSLLLALLWQQREKAAQQLLGDVLAGASFHAAHETAHLHVRQALDVSALDGVEGRVFGRLDASSAWCVTVYRAGEPWEPPAPVVDAASAREALAAGATVVVNGAQGADRALAALASNVTDATGMYGDINLYVSPPASAGLTAHHDVMDSVIVQVRHARPSTANYHSPTMPVIIRHRFCCVRQPGASSG